MHAGIGGSRINESLPGAGQKVPETGLQPNVTTFSLNRPHSSRSDNSQPAHNFDRVSPDECEKLFLAGRVPPVLNGSMKRERALTGLSGRRLKRLLHQLCEFAQNDVRRIARHEEVAIHQLRVRMKKILALLRLAQQGIEEHTLEAMRQHIRSIKNSCAGSRERTVRDKLIDKLARRFHLDARHRPKAPGAATVELSTSNLCHQLHALDLLIERSCIQALDEHQILEQHARCYRKGRRLMKECSQVNDSRTLHRWRHRVKDLCYQTLALSHLHGSARRIKRARRLGHMLGRDHDLANLSREPAFAVRRSPWCQMINERRDELRQRYLSIGHKLYGTHHSHFSDLVLHHA